MEPRSGPGVRSSATNVCSDSGLLPQAAHTASGAEALSCRGGEVRTRRLHGCAAKGERTLRRGEACRSGEAAWLLRAFGRVPHALRSAGSGWRLLEVAETSRDRD